MLSSFTGRLNLFPWERNHNLVTMNIFSGKSRNKKRKRDGKGNRETRIVTWNWSNPTLRHLPLQILISKTGTRRRKRDRRNMKIINTTHSIFSWTQHYSRTRNRHNSNSSKRFGPSRCPDRVVDWRSRLVHVSSKHLWNPCRLRDSRRGGSHRWWECWGHRLAGGRYKYFVWCRRCVGG